MNDIPARRSGVSADDAPSGAFVLRAWLADGSMRARVRSTVDIADSEAKEVADLVGPTETVVNAALNELRRWLDDFAATYQ